MASPVRRSVFFLLAIYLAACGTGELDENERSVSITPVVAWGQEVPDEQISTELHVGYGDVPSMALIRLEVLNIPPDEEGQRFTLIGGGAGDRGLHGVNATGFRGSGYQFVSPRHVESDQRRRTADYEADYSRSVINGRLVYDVYYEPSDLSEWGDEFTEEMEVGLQIVRAGTSEPVVYGPDELDQRWAVGDVRVGDTAHIIIDVGGDAAAE